MQVQHSYRLLQRWEFGHCNSSLTDAPHAEAGSMMPSSEAMPTPIFRGFDSSPGHLEASFETLDAASPGSWLSGSRGSSRDSGDLSSAMSPGPVAHLSYSSGEFSSQIKAIRICFQRSLLHDCPLKGPPSRDGSIHGRFTMFLSCCSIITGMLLEAKANC